jgi:hypothetical protein
MITHTAFITTENDEPDAGLLIQANDEIDGTSYYQGDPARIDDPGFALAGADGELDTDAAGRLLALAGFEMAGAGWSRSAGQWTARVQKTSGSE